MGVVIWGEDSRKLNMVVVNITGVDCGWHILLYISLKPEQPVFI